jgi:spermidine/putrescine transport system ATP-binding protein
MPPGFSRGVLIVRPENVAISDDAAPAAGGNMIRGELFNEYLLGSRIQYQVRSGAMVFLIEELRADAVARIPGAEVTLSWQPGDSMVFPE